MEEFFTGRRDHPGLPLLRQYLYAHRGYHDKPGIPENSLPAFKRAIDRGWGAELDVHLLKDGSLAVFHDSKLERCTGSEGILEDLDLEGLRALRLEGTEFGIPLFDEVLELFEAPKLPLIIELKEHGGNHRALAEAVLKRLDSYTGPFCLESFNPLVVLDIKKLRPQFIRGQLSQKFVPEIDGLSPIVCFVSSNLLLNFLTRPDFIAYRFKDRSSRANKKCLERGIQGVSWTIRSKEDLDKAISEGMIPIFERFDPEAK